MVLYVGVVAGEFEPQIPEITFERYKADKTRRLMPELLEEQGVYVFRYKEPGPIDQDITITDLYAKPVRIIPETGFYLLGVNFVDMINQKPRQVFLNPGGLAFNGRQGVENINELPIELEAGYFMDIGDLLDEELLELARSVGASSIDSLDYYSS